LYYFSPYFLADLSGLLSLFLMGCLATPESIPPTNLPAIAPATPVLEVAGGHSPQQPAPFTLSTPLEAPAVIEGIAPIWADLNGDGIREIIKILAQFNGQPMVPKSIGGCL